MSKYSLKKKALIIPMLIMVIVLTLFLFSCKSGMGPFGGPAEEAVVTFEVTRGDIDQTVSTTGNVDPRYSNNYSLSSSGTVLKALEEGDTFSEGDILIELDSNRTVLLMAQAEENIKISQNSLELAKLSYMQALDSNHIAVQLAETSKEQSELASASSYKSLENANNMASKSIESARIALENAEGLLAVAEGVPATDIFLEQYRGAVDSASAAYEAAKAQSSSSKDSAESGYDQSLLSQSTTYWSNLSSQQAAEAQIAITAKNIEQAEIQVRLAAINYELLGLDSDSHIIHAPYDGIIISSAYKKGEFAGPGIPAVNTASSELVIRSAVNETDIVNMEIGQEVIISLDAYYNEELKGEILDISPVSTNIGGVVSYTITVQIEKTSDIKLFHGLSASMEITTSFVEGVIYIPIEAVWEEDGKEYVDILVGEDAFERVEVETGIFNYDLIEIKSGLKEGDIIAVSGLE
ncbi:MAG: efflux RND transporter periplasmic adaptor subunit [Actinobacteria bacterium]|nr:efflux RND transporter periplasmic adaptor subunit [Actinomycetota bacterium]